MRILTLRSVGIAGTFITGVVCGLLLRSGARPAPPVHLPRVPAIDIGTRGRRPRPAATRPAASPAEATGSDEEWDTYPSDAEPDETGAAE